MADLDKFIGYCIGVHNPNIDGTINSQNVLYYQSSSPATQKIAYGNYGNGSYPLKRVRVGGSYVNSGISYTGTLGQNPYYNTSNLQVRSGTRSWDVFYCSDGSRPNAVTYNATQTRSYTEMTCARGCSCYSIILGRAILDM